LKRVGKGDEEKRSREWPSEAVGRLQAARQVTGRGRPYRTIEAALEAIRGGVEVDTAEIDLGSRQAGADAAIGEALQVLIGEIQALRLEVAELKRGRELSQPAAENKINKISAPVEKAVEEGPIVRLARRIEDLMGRGNKP
jgi:hypothetical protein